MEKVFTEDIIDIHNKKFYAHYNEAAKQWQTVSEHLMSTADLAEKNCTIPTLKKTAWLIGLFHDTGKYSDLFQDYLKQAIENPDSVRRGEVDHATAGGILLEHLTSHVILAEIMQVTIFSHHGLYDCISLKKGESLFEIRAREDKKHEISFEQVTERIMQDIQWNHMLPVIETARNTLVLLLNDIQNFLKDKPKYGNRDFYLGMCVRILMSSLIDADRTDTTAFMRNSFKQNYTKIDSEESIWKNYIEHFENYIRKFTVGNKIDSCRKEISDICRKIAQKPGRLYRLTVPTGAGKTLSALRFAIHHAEKYQKKHIFYVAAYNSILDQNAEEIRKALGDNKNVLEHHSNILHDPENVQEEERLSRLMENWDSPIVVTTTVQLLNTLFSSKTGSVRRMHNLCDSIIIFDEIQTLPIRIIHLFNMAVNYLTQFCNTTIVLCSATQPVLDEIRENRILEPLDMTGKIEKYLDDFHRVNFIDKTREKQGGFSINDMGAFVETIFEKEKQVLVIVNTKSCARKLYEYLQEKQKEKSQLFHLSTNMCVTHRQEVLKKMGDVLAKNEDVICVSTQLIEAGVDISARCVVRSLAGLDSIIQAAGRCNRHGKEENGKVYIVRMSKEEERVGSLPDINEAQKATESILYELSKETTESYDELELYQAVPKYYRRYFFARQDEMGYREEAAGNQTSLVELLSQNKPGRHEYERMHDKPPKKGTQVLGQAFKTAGDLFQVIPEDGKFDVVIAYNEEAMESIDTLQNIYLPYDKQKQHLRVLQRYTVGISEQTKSRLGNAIYPICGGLAFGLSKNYYSKEIGVSEEPAGMGFLNS